MTSKQTHVIVTVKSSRYIRETAKEGRTEIVNSTINYVIIWQNSHTCSELCSCTYYFPILLVSLSHKEHGFIKKDGRPLQMHIKNPERA